MNIKQFTELMLVMSDIREMKYLISKYKSSLFKKITKVGEVGDSRIPFGFRDSIPFQFPVPISKNKRF